MSLMTPSGPDEPAASYVPMPAGQMTQTLCLAVACADCGFDWCENSADAGILHFPYQAPDLLAKMMVEEQGWEFVDGAYVCDLCAKYRRCAANGHKWGPWSTYSGMLKAFRYCRECGRDEARPVEVVDAVEMP